MDLLKGVEEIFATMESLKAEDVVSDCVLIGGLAVSIWGRPRATRDIDLLLLLNIATDVSTLSDRLTVKGVENELIKGDLRDTVPYILKITLESADIDVIIAVKSWEVEAVESAVNIDCEGLNIPIVSPEYLVVMKLKAGGPRDLLDVQDILETGNIDIAKTMELAKRYKVDKKLEKVKITHDPT